MLNLNHMAEFYGLNDGFYNRTQQKRLSWFYKVTHINLILLFLFILLCGFALILLYAAAGGSESPWMIKQAWRMGIALIGIFIIALLDPIFLMRMVLPFFLLCFGLLLSVELFGISAGGAKRWLPLAHITIQPSEFMKIALIMIVARLYQMIRPEYYHGIWIHFVMVFIAIIPIFLVLRQPDLGTAMAMLFPIIIVIFLVGASWKLFILGGLTTIVSIPIIWLYLFRDYQKQRILTFLDPERDPLGSGYHILQSKIAMGSGGFFGKGFLQGSQSQLQFLPEQHTDFIFALLVEEWGLFGAFFLILIYSSVIVIGFIIALYAKSPFHKLVGGGLTTMFGFHALVNIAMVTGLLPVVGIPLPLISYGGTSFLVNSFIFAMLIHISIHKHISLPNYYKK